MTAQKFSAVEFEGEPLRLLSGLTLRELQRYLPRLHYLVDRSENTVEITDPNFALKAGASYLGLKAGERGVTHSSTSVLIYIVFFLAERRCFFFAVSGDPTHSITKPSSRAD